MFLVHSSFFSFSVKVSSSVIVSISEIVFAAVTVLVTAHNTHHVNNASAPAIILVSIIFHLVNSVALSSIVGCVSLILVSLAKTIWLSELSDFSLIKLNGSSTELVDSSTIVGSSLKAISLSELSDFLLIKLNGSSAELVDSSMIVGSSVKTISLSELLDSRSNRPNGSS
ncbi:MAG: hypothetical protein U9Q66_01365 [Patescibacteria group bacterium]|nr:hypothetical protein [Patescibacteria group bacterium]